MNIPPHAMPSNFELDKVTLPLLFTLCTRYIEVHSNHHVDIQIFNVVAGKYRISLNNVPGL